MSKDKFAAIMVIAKQAERDMKAAGASAEHAEEAFKAIAYFAGSYLPPVSGTFNINLTDTKVN